MKLIFGLASAVLATALAAPSQAAVIFSDDFDTDTSASYNVNFSGGNNAATFAYDYSAVGVPPSPNGGGSTKGLKLEANYTPTGQVQSGVSVSPKLFGVTADFDVRFDLWQNSIGPFSHTNGDGGPGSTQVTIYGWGTSGTAAQWAGARDSVVYGVTGEGNSAIDWRIYPNSGTIPTTSPPYVALPANGNVQNAAHPYYVSAFPGQTVPAAQTALFPAFQTGAPQDGTLAFKWHDVLISKRGNTLSWTIDGVPIANVDLTGVGALGGTNIFFGQTDINNGASTHANVRDLLFGLIDNVTVTQIPEPAGLALLSLAALGLVAVSRRS